MTVTMNTDNILNITEDLAYEGKDVMTGEIYRRNISDALALIKITISLPVLTGSEKQIAWAEDIRLNKIADAAQALRDTIAKRGAELSITACQAKNANIQNISDAFELLITSHPRIQIFLTATSASDIIDNR